MDAIALYEAVKTAIDLIDRWCEERGFDECGGPDDDADWLVVRACHVLEDAAYDASTGRATW
jgi:hypothetical protein